MRRKTMAQRVWMGSLSYAGTGYRRKNAETERNRLGRPIDNPIGNVLTSVVAMNLFRYAVA